jgi:hypothetical protein
VKTKEQARTRQRNKYGKSTKREQEKEIRGEKVLMESEIFH